MRCKAYLDNNATTALDSRVADYMIQDDSFLSPSNPSSVHTLGQRTKSKITKARQIIAEYLHAKPQEILFTSGGTESMNFLIRGLIRSHERPHILSSAIEHSCVEKTLLFLQAEGCQVTFLPVSEVGSLALELIEQHITPSTKLLVFSAANGETGVLQDLEDLSALALRHRIPLIIDGVALFGKEPIAPLPPGITGMGFSGHKFHGPKGVGFVFLRSGTKISPLLLGGGQEYGLRSGTENVSQILGLSKAVELLQEELPASSLRMLTLRDYFETRLRDHLPSMLINGLGRRVCNVSNLCFPGVDAETLLIMLDQHQIAASHGSACSSGALEPSRILLQMGLPKQRAQSSIRFSLSRQTTQEEIDYALQTLIHLLPKLTP